MTTFKLSTVAAVAAIVVGTSTLGWGLQQALSQTADDNPFGGAPSAGVRLAQQEGATTPDPTDPFPAKPGAVEGVGGVGPSVPAGTGQKDQANSTAQTVPPQTTEDSTYDVVPRSETERKIRAALEEPARIDFVDMPLDEILATIERSHNFPIVVDKRALLDVGVDTSVPITVSFHDMSLRSALPLMLRQLELTYIIEDEYMLITTEEEAEQRVRARVYPVHPDWNVSPQELISTITTTVMPDSWSTVGGSGSIQALGNNLVVMQTAEAHERLNDLLRQLDRAAEMQPQQAGFGMRPQGGRSRGDYNMGYDGGYGEARTGGGYGAGGIGPPSSAGSGYGSGAEFGPQSGRRGTAPPIGGNSTDEGPADNVLPNTQRQ